MKTAIHEVIGPGSETTNEVRQHVSQSLHRPVEICTPGFWTSERPKRRWKRKTDMMHITNLPVLHDLKFIIPHKISGERIRVRDETENDDQNDMPATERRRPGSLIFRFFLHNFHLSLHGMKFLPLVLTLLLAQIPKYNP